MKHVSDVFTHGLSDEGHTDHGSGGCGGKQLLVRLLVWDLTDPRH